MRLISTSPRSLWIMLLMGTLVVACKKKDPAPASPPPSFDKAITAFGFKQAVNSAFIYDDIEGVIGNTDTIKVTVPAETDIRSMVPGVVFKGKSVTPASGVAQNFSSPVSYTVTAEDGTQKKYVVSTVYRKTVFISSGSGYLYALDGLTGKLIWQSENPDFPVSTAPAVVNGIVYASAYNGICALDARNGVQKWKFNIPKHPYYSDSPGLMVVDNTVYMGSWEGFIYAVNASDGTLRWKASNTTGGSFTANITVAGSTLYAGCLDSSLYAFDITNGAIKWKFNCPDPVYQNPLVVDGTVYVGSQGHHFFAIDASNGTLKWEYLYNLPFSSPTYYEGRVYFGGGLEVVGLNAATGKDQWYDRLNVGDKSNLIIQDGISYGTSEDGNLYARKINTNIILWKTPTIYYMFSGPVLAEGVLYYGNINGVVHAIDAATGNIMWKYETWGQVRGSACVVDSKGVKHYAVDSGHQN